MLVLSGVLTLRFGEASCDMDLGQIDNGGCLPFVCQLQGSKDTDVNDRAELQKAFFPPTYQDTQETDRLRPGDTRVWTAMKVFVELRDDTTLHLPFREASKVVISHLYTLRD